MYELGLLGIECYAEDSDARPGEYVGGGLSQTRIVFWGKKTVMADGDIGKVELTFSEVAYVPEWRKNVLSADVLEKKGVFYDSERKVLYRSSSKEVIARLSAHDGFRYLVYVPRTSDVDYSAYAAMPTTTIYEGEAVKPRQATALQWHAILGHPGKMSLSKLEKVTIGAKVTDMATAPTTTDCEPCALSKAKRIVSRRSGHQKETSEPFERVGFDLIPMETSMDGMQWVSHLNCYATKCEMVECHSRKSDAVNILERFITSISVRFKKKVRFVQTDDEQALGRRYDDLQRIYGFTSERSAPYSAEQNGNNEKSGHLIIMRARTMRIGANLPAKIWPAVVEAAVYTLNRTPTRSLGWKTPFEAVTGRKPSLAHLRVYGCRAYALKPKIPQKDKLVERAHVGYLVGYDSTNIFKVYVPSLNKVIRVRDVTFNESLACNNAATVNMLLKQEPKLNTKLRHVDIHQH